jgi:hypothetical protein
MGGVEIRRDRSADAGVDTIVINELGYRPRSSARVDKVLLPSSRCSWPMVVSIASSGCNMVALAASRMASPCGLCRGSLSNFVPMFPHEGQDTLRDFSESKFGIRSQGTQRPDP